MTTVLLALVLLNPVRLYFQPHQPVIVKLDTQAIAQTLAQATANDQPAPALKLVLLSDAGYRYASVPLKADTAEVDLAKLFNGKGDPATAADLWGGQTYYVQLVAGEKSIGSPLVVVPLFPPGMANKVPANALRIYPEKLIQFETSLGNIAFRLDPKVAPTTTMLFSQLVQGGFYTNVIFHRIIPGFVIQGGDPTGDGTGGPGFYMDLERSRKLHTKGTLSMARQGRDVNTSGSQFFICLSRQGCASLDGQYTAFGDLVWGMDVVDKMAALPTDQSGANRPLQPPVIRQATLVAAPSRLVGHQPPAQLTEPKAAPSQRQPQQ